VSQTAVQGSVCPRRGNVSAPLSPAGLFLFGFRLDVEALWPKCHTDDAFSQNRNAPSGAALIAWNRLRLSPVNARRFLDLGGEALHRFSGAGAGLLIAADQKLAALRSCSTHSAYSPLRMTGRLIQHVDLVRRLR
jgi:hypothetical protein